MFLVVLKGLQDLRSLIRDLNQGLSSESASPNYWTSRKFLENIFLKEIKRQAVDLEIFVRHHK